jgi:hypothetical protein
VSPAARSLFHLRADQCRWPSRHHLDDQRFHWCGAAVEYAGAPYCIKHSAKARDHGDQPPGVRLAIERTGLLGRVGRPPDAVRPRPVPTTQAEIDAHHARAQRLADGMQL